RVALLKEIDRVNEEVIKIHRIAIAEAFPVETEYQGGFLLEEVESLLGILLRRDQLIFCAADARADCLRIELLLGDVEPVHDIFYDAERVSGIINGKIPREADLLALFAQYSREDGMESSHPELG